jgi:hypothetical protein
VDFLFTSANGAHPDVGLRATPAPELRTALHWSEARLAAPQNGLAQAARRAPADEASRLQPDVKVHAAAEQLHAAARHVPAAVTFPPAQDGWPRVAAGPQFAPAVAVFPLPDVQTRAVMKRIRAAARHEPVAAAFRPEGALRGLEQGGSSHGREQLHAAARHELRFARSRWIAPGDAVLPSAPLPREDCLSAAELPNAEPLRCENRSLALARELAFPAATPLPPVCPVEERWLRSGV